MITYERVKAIRNKCLFVPEHVSISASEVATKKNELKAIFPDCAITDPFAFKITLLDKIYPDRTGY